VAPGRNRKKPGVPSRAKKRAAAQRSTADATGGPSPSAAPPKVRSAGGSRGLAVPVERALPRTFQGRLSLAFVMVFALAVGIVSVLTVFVLDNDLRGQEMTNLEARANAVAAVVRVKADTTAAQPAKVDKMKDTPAPKRIPRIPPIVDSTADSIRN